MMAFGAKIKLSVNTSGASAFRSEIQKYVNTATASNPIKLKNFSVSMTKEQQKKIVRDIQTYLSGDTTLTLKIGKIDATGAVNKLRQQLQTMLSGLSITGLKEFLGETNINKITQDIDKAKQSASQWAAQMRVIDDIQKRLGSTYRSALSGSQMVGDATQVQQITAAYTAWQVKVEELRNTKVALSAEELQNLQQEGIALQQKITLIQEEQAAIAGAATEAERAAAQEEIAARKQLALAQQQVSLKSQVQRYILSNSKAYKVYGAELDGIMHTLQSEASLTDEQLKTIRMRFYEIQTSAKAAGMSGNTFFDTLKKGFAKFGGWSLITRTLMAVYRIFTNMITAVKDLDAAMTELRKVTDLSEQSYREYLNTAKELSQTIGATLADTVNATADFARLGYSITDSTALAEAALVYKNVGDGIEDIGTASESLISTIKAFEQFGESASNAMSIIDRFNEVGNNFAISSEGIGAALQRSASSLAAAGNNLNESIALVTGMNAVVQDPEKVGTALKTIAMYLRAAKTEAEEAGESTEGMANSVSELRSELLTLTKGKVDIMIDDETFKSTYQIMKELSQVWDELSDIDAANILELIGGKRNANAVTSLLTNFEDAEKALQTAAKASGSALAENEKYLDSIAGKLSVFQSKFETFSNNLISSNTVKMVVDLGSVLLDVLNALQQIHALLPLLAFSTALIMGQLNANKINTIVQQFVLQKQAIIEQKVVSDQLAVSLAGLNAQQRRLLKTEIERILSSEAVDDATKKQILSTLGLAGAEGTLSVANKGLAASFKSLMSSIPIWGWIALGVSVIIEAISAISTFADSIETTEEKLTDLKDKFTEIANEIESSATEFRDLNKSAKDMIPRFVELAQGVDEFGKNVSLTDEEYEEFLSLNNQLAEMFPEINMGMDSNGNAMLTLSYASDTLAESLNNLVEAEREAANIETAGKMTELVSNLSEQTQLYRDQIDDLRDDEEHAISQIKGKRSWSRVIKTEADDKYKAILEKYDIDYTSKGKTTARGWGVDYIVDDVEGAHQKVRDITEKQVNAIEEEINSVWKQLQPVVTAWIQTNSMYQSMDDDMQSIATKMSSYLEYGTSDLDTQDEIEDYIEDNIIEPLYNAEPEVQNAIGGLFTIKDLFSSGDLTAGEYTTVVNEIVSDLEKAGISGKTLELVKLSVGIEDIEEKINYVKDLLSDEFDGRVDELSAEELEFAYKIVADSGSLSFDELEEKIKELRYASADMVDVLDFTDTVSGLSDTVDGLNSIISAMEKLNNGTALTKAELSELALEYPKLLEQANLFTDGSIEGQKNLLDTVLDLKEKEYDAQLDAKIAELKATEQVINDQLAMETDKANIIAEIKNMSVNGEIEQEEDLVNKMTELNDLQGQNYVKMEDGILAVNEEALNDKLSSEAEYGTEAATNIWEPYASTIKTAHTEGYSSSLGALDKYSGSLFTKLKNIASKAWGALANAVGDALNGEWKDISYYFSQAFSSGDNTITAPEVTVTFDGKKAYVGDQSIDDWISDQEKASVARIEALEDFKQRTVNAYKNLEALKGLDLTTIYGSGKTSSSKSDDDVDEYLANIDKYYEAIKRLEAAQAKRENLENELSHTDDPAAKIKLLDQLVDAYREEAAAEQNLINKRTQTIQDNAAALRALGFEVEYNANTNDFYIKNLEHLNELTATSKGEYDTLQEATNALRESTEDLINTTEDLNNENQDSIDNIEDLTYEIQDASEEIIDCIEEVYKAQIESYNEIIEKRKEAIESAKEEYDYESDVADKVKEIAELQARIDKLSLDNSREAQAERAALIEELSEKQKELADTQGDHAYDEQIEALDQMGEKYEEEKNAELEILRSSIGTVQELGTAIDERITNAWNNAKRAVEAYGLSVAGLNGGVSTIVGTVPQYHSGGVVAGNASTKEEVFALLEAGEIVLNDQEQQSFYRIIDFQSKLSERLGVDLGRTIMPLTTLDTTPNFGGVNPGVVNTSTQTVFNPEFNIEISHNGEMSDDEARRYGEEIAETAIAKLYNAFERKGISNHNGAKLRP